VQGSEQTLEQQSGYRANANQPG